MHHFPSLSPWSLQCLNARPIWAAPVAESLSGKDFLLANKARLTNTFWTSLNNRNLLIITMRKSLDSSEISVACRVTQLNRENLWTPIFLNTSHCRRLKSAKEQSQIVLSITKRHSSKPFKIPGTLISSLPSGPKLLRWATLLGRKSHCPDWCHTRWSNALLLCTKVCIRPCSSPTETIPLARHVFCCFCLVCFFQKKLQQKQKPTQTKLTGFCLRGSYIYI